LSYGFSKKALWEQESIIQEFVNRLQKNFNRFADEDEVFDTVRWFNYITFDVIGDLSFGESFGCLAEGQYHSWIPIIFDAVKAGAIEQTKRRFATPGSSTQQWLMSLIPNELRKRRRDRLPYSREKLMK
jgi:hypothetical protein